MNAAVTGVTVVTTRPAPVGHTVSAMCSVSDEPPLLLVAIAAPRRSRRDRQRGEFAVTC